LFLASFTASTNAQTLRGKQATNTPVVKALPQSGAPDVNSKTQPTAAIAATQEIPKNTLLFGVIIIYSLRVFKIIFYDFCEDFALFSANFNSF
jgi:hypothetical protein